MKGEQAPRLLLPGVAPGGSKGKLNAAMRGRIAVAGGTPALREVDE